MENFFAIEFEGIELSKFTEIVSRLKGVTDVPFTISMITRGRSEDY